MSGAGCLVAAAERAAPVSVGGMSLPALRRRFRGGASPGEVIRTLYRRPRMSEADPAWIHVAPEEEVLARVAEIERRAAAGEDLPLFGIPFAVKDNIDVAGMPTTAACPAFSYRPERSATAVQRLLDAGALCLGKTNLDQFATGLNGTRSPYGACASVFDPQIASGGSSSGSAIAVAEGLVTFALGTDTGGSGRIPAAFNNVVGLKPTVGLVSLRGVVPNCRTLDCVSVFAGSTADAEAVLAVMAGPDPEDPFSRRPAGDAPRLAGWERGRPFRFGVPRLADREFFGDPDAAGLFAEAIGRLEQLGGEAVDVDLRPFLEAGSLMFGGAWVAERVAGLRSFMETRTDALLPVTADIMRSASGYSAVDMFEQLYRLKALKLEADRILRRIDVLVTPTAPRPHRIAEIEADPIRLNNRYGHYSYFVNLLDLCAVAVPAGFLASSRIAMGITLVAPAFQDGAVARLASSFHAATGLAPGIDARPLS